jgi:hypothetical protein
MGVPPVELLKLPLSLCNASRRVSINVPDAVKRRPSGRRFRFHTGRVSQNRFFRIPAIPRTADFVTSRDAVRAIWFTAASIGV